MNKLHIGSLTLLAALAVVGCSGGGINGKYTANTMGVEMTMDFQPGGKMNMTLLGQNKPGTYKVEGDKVHVTIDNSTNDFVIEKDGTLTSGNGQLKMVFKKS